MDITHTLKDKQASNHAPSAAGPSSGSKDAFANRRDLIALRKVWLKYNYSPAYHLRKTGGRVQKRIYVTLKIGFIEKYKSWVSFENINRSLHKQQMSKISASYKY